jgi:hypothetical protein
MSFAPNTLIEGRTTLEAWMASLRISVTNALYDSVQWGLFLASLRLLTGKDSLCRSRSVPIFSATFKTAQMQKISP